MIAETAAEVSARCSAMGGNRTGALVRAGLKPQNGPPGGVAFGWNEPRTFSPREREFLKTLVHYCTGALERGRLFATGWSSPSSSNQTWSSVTSACRT